jgi:nucleoside-diphosphate-sugar epimerase
MRVLLLGGTRFIGPYVVRELAERGHDVTIVHRGETEAELPESVRHVHASFDALPLDELHALDPEVVVDMVPLVRADAARLRAFAGVAERAVAVSSADVYRAFGRLRRSEPGPPDPVPLAEDAPLRTIVIDPGYDKVGVEEELTCGDALPVAILRAPAIHGPRDRQRRLREYAWRIADSRPAILLDERVAGWRWVRGYVENAAAAVVAAIERAPSAHRVYNVADAEQHDEAAWVRRIAAVAGWNGDVVIAPAGSAPGSESLDELDLAQDVVLDTTRIRSELGWSEPLDEAEGIRRTLEWELAQPDDGPPRDYDAEDALLERISSSGTST